MKTTLRNGLQALVFGGIGVSILLLVYNHQNTAYVAECGRNSIAPAECNLLAKLVTDFTHVDFRWIAAVLLGYVASTVSRACKWMLLLQPLGFKPRFANTFLAVCIAYFANLGLPRVGDFVRAGLMARYERIPVERVLGTIVADRTVDLLFLGAVMTLALVLEFDRISGFVAGRGSLPGGAAWVAVGAIGLTLVVLLAVLLVVFRQRLATTGIYQQTSGRLVGFRAGLRSIRRLQHPVWFVLHNVNIWLLSFLMTWMSLQAFAPTAALDLRAALTVFVFATLGIVVPSPGGMGTFHLLVISALTLFYGVRGDDAFSAANIFFFSVNVGFTIVLGLLSLAALPLINRRGPLDPAQRSGALTGS